MCKNIEILKKKKKKKKKKKIYYIITCWSNHMYNKYNNRKNNK